MQHVTLIVDGVRVTVRTGTSLIEAASEAGVEIPSLCFLPGLPPRGVCRVCSVSVSGSRGLVPGCATPAAEGMEVTTPTAEQLKAFRDVAQPAVINWLSGEIGSEWIEKLQSAVGEAEASM